MTFTVILDDKDFQSFFFFLTHMQGKYWSQFSHFNAFWQVACSSRGLVSFSLRPYLELLLLPPHSLEAAVSSSDVCRCISSREETLGLGGGGWGRPPLRFQPVSAEFTSSPPGGAPVKAIRPPVYILSFPSPPLPFPSLSSRRLFPLNAFQAVSTLWSS